MPSPPSLALNAPSADAVVADASLVRWFPRCTSLSGSPDHVNITLISPPFGEGGQKSKGLPIAPPVLEYLAGLTD